MALPRRNIGPMASAAPNMGGISFGPNNIAPRPQASMPMRPPPQQQQSNGVMEGAQGIGLLSDVGAFDGMKNAGMAAMGYHPSGGLPYMAGSSFPGSAGLASNAGLAGLQAGGEFGGLTAAQMGTSTVPSMFGSTATGLGGPAGIGASMGGVGGAGSLAATGAAAGGAMPAAALVGGAAQGAGMGLGAAGAAGAAGAGAGAAGAAGAGAAGAAAGGMAMMGPVGWAALAGLTIAGLLGADVI